MPSKLLHACRKDTKAELDSLTCHETRSNGGDDNEIDRAIESLKNLGKVLNDASPGDTKKLLSSIVTRIELHFEECSTGRQKREFTHGDIYVRPDVGGSLGDSPDGEVTQLSRIRWEVDASEQPPHNRFLRRRHPPTD